MRVTVGRAERSFDRWDELHDLLMRCFAYMAPRIDPPSSLLRISAADLKRKSRDEVLFLAMDGERLAGCAFVRLESAPDRNCAYVGKLAVDGDYRGQGITRRFMAEVEKLAREHGLDALELQTRIELAENRETFERLDFVKTQENAHEGYDRPTNITMRRRLT